MLDFIIKLDQKQDAREFKNFLDSEMVKQWYPEIKTTAEVNKFIEMKYYQDKKKLNERVDWLKSEQDNLRLIANRLSQLIGEHWDGIKEITIYPSVCPMCPRFLETHSFMVNYQFYRPDIYSVCAHEMTHFLYFKNLEKQLKQWEKEYPSDDWVLSEVFVPCVLNDEEVIKDFTGCDGGVFGVDLSEEQIKHLQGFWHGDLLAYRQQGLKYLKQQKSLS